MLEGHQKYETWVDRNKERYAVGRKGFTRYPETLRVGSFANALFSQPFISDFRVTVTSCYDQHTRPACRKLREPQQDSLGLPEKNH